MYDYLNRVILRKVYIYIHIHLFSQFIRHLKYLAMSTYRVCISAETLLTVLAVDVLGLTVTVPGLLTIELGVESTLLVVEMLEGGFEADSSPSAPVTVLLVGEAPT